MFLLKCQFVRLKEVRMLSLTDGEGKGLDYFMEGLFIFIRKEIEEDFPEKVLLNARRISL